MMSIREQLLSIFGADEPEYGRAAALGPAAIPALREMIDEDHHTASAAVDTAGLIASHDALDVLAHAIERGGIIRVHAAGALGEFASRSGSAEDLTAASKILAPLLGDFDPTVRRFAQRAAAAFPEGVFGNYPNS